MLNVDKGYDSDAIRRQVKERDAFANIPPKVNRKWKNCFSPYLYRDRNAIERMSAASISRPHPPLPSLDPHLAPDLCQFLCQLSHSLDQLVPKAMRPLGILPHGGAVGRVLLDCDRQILDRLAVDESAGDLTAFSATAAPSAARSRQEHQGSRDR